MPDGASAPRVAIAHDYLTQRGGAERVVLAMMRAFPDAPVHTTLYDPDGTYPEFRDARIITSPLNRIAALRRNHRAALPLVAWASNRMQVDADVVIVSSSGWAHGFPSPGHKLVYCHAPARWLYQPTAYLGGPAHRSLRGLLLTGLRPYLLRWDRAAAASAARYLANSTVVRERVEAAYGVAATVLPAPHGIAGDSTTQVVPEVADWSDGFHLVVSRLLPYKNVDRVIDAFTSLPDERLVIIGAGPEEDRLRRLLPANVRMVKDLGDAQMRWAYAHADALVAPSLEDYGLTPLEAGAFGKPTVALRAGGYLDTVAEGLSGLFVDQASAEDIRAGVLAAREHPWDSEAIKVHVSQFDEEHFQRGLREAVTDLVATTPATRPGPPRRQPAGPGD